MDLRRPFLDNIDQAEHFKQIDGKRAENGSNGRHSVLTVPLEDEVVDTETLEQDGEDEAVDTAADDEDALRLSLGSSAGVVGGSCGCGGGGFCS